MCPLVGSQKLPYTPAGMKTAKLLSKRTGRKIIMSEDMEDMMEMKKAAKKTKKAKKK